MLTPPPPIRIKKGQATDEELAALAGLLLSRAIRAGSDAQASTPGTTSWRPRPFCAPHSWQMP
ncbi:acyl-CoA carboxylase epsilon subunit [Streptomyces sp. CNQ085]|uniref:acyl-CoA carboxylase epsilon subunit n=1 Tax=Streptomyces sp. CNQ085 TaxID=2886944 RepID=UPI001F508040|nr:acyl-CoA carboxylase epsilon subunit [Streptomyces sp. CNQ085]MCI0382973.1 acyl-CoA carboxylase subunit epsilon [Streptomyces sp. CNQ085]